MNCCVFTVSFCFLQCVKATGRDLFCESGLVREELS